MIRFFLIGLMGSGKTYWAQRLKKKYKIPAYDLDNLVEIMQEKTISEMFKEDGEAHFRKEEAKMLRLFKEKKQFILACGGGTPCFHHNMNWMNKNGITIWIDEPIDTLVERISHFSEQRPAISGLDADALKDWLQTKLEERVPFYNQALYHFRHEDINENSFGKLFKQYA